MQQISGAILYLLLESVAMLKCLLENMDDRLEKNRRQFRTLPHPSGKFSEMCSTQRNKVYY